MPRRSLHLCFLVQIARLVLSGHIDEINVVGGHGMHLQLVIIFLNFAIHACTRRGTPVLVVPIEAFDLADQLHQQPTRGSDEAAEQSRLCSHFMWE